MQMGWVVPAALLFLSFPAADARGQVAKTPNTLTLAQKEGSPKARIGEVAWLAGRWIGDFMGGKGEEVFAPPQGEAFGRGRSLSDRRPRCFERGRCPGSQREESPRGEEPRAAGAGASEGPGERSSPHPGEPRADA